VPRPSDRARLIADLERRHLASSFPRGQLTLLVAGAGLAGFLSSVALLRAGLDQMAFRYPAAVLAAYLAFLGLLRLWIAWQRGQWSPDVDVFPETRGSAAGQNDLARELAHGGRSGGAGGGARWDGQAHGIVAKPAAAPSSGGSGGGFDLDLDEGWWLVLAAVLVLGGALAVVYVIYIAPVLLAEVALDAAVVTTMYKRLKPHDLQHWSVGVIRQTWLPALILVLCLAGAGFALQQVAPEARSIGGVLAHLRS
jgi:hypothetical protein